MAINFTKDYEKVVNLLKELGFEKIKQFNYENFSSVTFTNAEGKERCQNWYAAIREEYYRMGGFIFGLEVYEKHETVNPNEVREKHIFKGIGSINQVRFIGKIKNTKENKALFYPKNLTVGGSFPSIREKYFYMNIRLTGASFEEFEQYFRNLLSIHIKKYDFQDNESYIWCEYLNKTKGTNDFIPVKELLKIESTDPI